MLGVEERQVFKRHFKLKSNTYSFGAQEHSQLRGGVLESLGQRGTPG